MQEYNTKANRQSSKEYSPDNSNDKFLEDSLKKISSAYKSSKDNRDMYNKYLNLVYVNSLTEEDLKLLGAESRSTLTVPVIKPALAQQMRNVRDSIPDISISYYSDDATPEDKIASDSLTDRIQSVLDNNRYDDKMTDAATKAGSGGFGVIKLSTEYISKKSFEQKIVIKSICDPTMVLFDPEAKEITKIDGNHVTELTTFNEDDFKEKFPDVDLDEINANKYDYDSSGINWLDEDSNGKKIITVASYFYKENIEKTLYLVKSYGDNLIDEHRSNELNINNNDEGDYGYDVETTEEPPENKDLILDTKKYYDVKVKMVEICGNKILSEAQELNFKHIPIIFFPSDTKTIDGKEVIIPFAKPAIDAQRVKDISLNYFMFEVVNNASGRFMAPEEGRTDSLDEMALNPSAKKVGYYKSIHNVDGEIIPLNRPDYMASTPLPMDHLAVLNQMDESVNKTLGAHNQPIENANMSGVALYNLADFMSASTSTLMSNMISVAAGIGEIILHAFPMLYNKQVSKITNANNEIVNNVIDYSEVDVGEFCVKVDKGSNYALQQEATVERLLKLGTVSPTMAKWLDSQGITFILQNSSLSEKTKIIESYEKFKKAEMLAAQRNPSQPTPDMIKAMAANQTSQAAIQRAQNDAQRVQLESMELQQDMHSNNVDQALNVNNSRVEDERSRRELAAQIYKQQSENARESARLHIDTVSKLSRGK